MEDREHEHTQRRPKKTKNKTKLSDSACVHVHVMGYLDQSCQCAVLGLISSALGFVPKPLCLVDVNTVMLKDSAPNRIEPSQNAIRQNNVT